MAEEANYSIEEICKIYKLCKYTLLHWQVKYETAGIEGLKESSTWKPYTKELKEAHTNDS